MAFEKVLFVDDEEAILNGFRRALHKDFDVHLATGGEAGLIAIRDKGPFAVIVSDMRMPGMNGATFLSKVRAIQPLSTRMLLTGYSDAEAAADAINQGQIFRFLSKPCDREDLVASLNVGIEKYKQRFAEKALLEGTLLGSIRTLSEVLSVVSPLSFERTTRMSACVKHLVARTVLEQPWQVEAAALLSQIGCLALAPDMIRSAHRGISLDPEDQLRYSQHPQLASELVAHIPRMQGVAWIIRNQEGSPFEGPLDDFSPTEMGELALGAEMLRMAIAYDTFWLKGVPHPQAVFGVRKAFKSFPRVLLDALESMKPCEKVLIPKTLLVQLLTEEMIIDEDILNPAGALLVGSGQPISKAMLMKLKEYSEAGTIRKQVRVLA